MNNRLSKAHRGRMAEIDAVFRTKMEQPSDHFRLGIARLAVLPALPAIAAPSSPSSAIAYLPSAQINTAKVDASGNIYLAGQTTTKAGSAAAYIVGLGPNGRPSTRSLLAVAVPVPAPSPPWMSIRPGGIRSPLRCSASEG
jgi:hypothetical protein